MGRRSKYDLTGLKISRSKYNPTDVIYNRKCHDCGKPTNNYRCSACWEKKGLTPPHTQQASPFEPVLGGSSKGRKASSLINPTE